MFDIMKNLITRKFYDNKEKILELLDLYVAFNRITIEQYSELNLLTEDTYVEIIAK